MADDPWSEIGSTIYQGWIASYMRTYNCSREVAEHAINDFYRKLEQENNG
jgi:hypothetical protein